jgi:hypothetical protein
MRAKCQEKNDDEVEKVATISSALIRPLTFLDHKKCREWRSATINPANASCQL